MEQTEFDEFLKENPGYWSWCGKIDERKDLDEVGKYKKKTEHDFSIRSIRFGIRAYSLAVPVWMFVYSVLFFALSIWIYRSFFEFSQDYTFYYVFGLFSLAFFFFMLSMIAASADEKKTPYIEDYLLDRMQMNEKYILDLLERVKELEKKNYRLEEEEKRQREYDV